MPINGTPAFNPYINNNPQNTQAKEDKKTKKELARKEKIKTGFDYYKEKRKGLSRDAKTIIKAGIIGVAAASYLWFSGKGTKLLNWIKRAFQ